MGVGRLARCRIRVTLVPGMGMITGPLRWREGSGRMPPEPRSRNFSRPVRFVPGSAGLGIRWVCHSGRVPRALRAALRVPVGHAGVCPETHPGQRTVGPRGVAQPFCRAHDGSAPTVTACPDLDLRLKNLFWHAHRENCSRRNTIAFGLGWFACAVRHARRPSRAAHRRQRKKIFASSGEISPDCIVASSAPD
jgi:hypothetical protein